MPLDDYFYCECGARLCFIPGDKHHAYCTLCGKKYDYPWW